MLVACLVCIFAGYLFGRASVYHNGVGANDTRKQLQQLEANQRDLTGAIREAAAGAGCVAEQAGNIREGLLQAKEQSASLSSEIRTAGSIIDESREIISSVRSRGTAGSRSED